ncbi:MAG: hypothetical protein HY290_32470 [Planctomycetia bacterium]|nr:hypothetical protein [Planctomycetia bacterium]
MSYDLTIKADETYSRMTSKSGLCTFIAQLPGIKPNGGSGFVLDERPKRWMEIDLEVIEEDGYKLQEAGRDYDAINCISLHIPYPFLGDAIERHYLPTAFAIADHLDWQLYDEQIGEDISREPRTRKPWWRFW